MPVYVARRNNLRAVDVFQQAIIEDIAESMRDPRVRSQMRRTLRRGVAVARAAAPQDTGTYRRSVTTHVAVKSRGKYPNASFGIKSRVKSRRNTRGTRNRVRPGQALGLEYGNESKVPVRQPLQRGFDTNMQNAVRKQIVEGVSVVNRRSAHHLRIEMG